MLKNRVRNYGLWLSIAAFIPLVLSAFGIKITNEQQYNEIINAILTLFVALGLLNNPNTENRWYKDDTKKLEESLSKTIKE